jgi:intraflagellar transport protein 46
MDDEDNQRPENDNDQDMVQNLNEQEEDDDQEEDDNQEPQNQEQEQPTPPQQPLKKDIIQPKPPQNIPTNNPTAQPKIPQPPKVEATKKEAKPEKKEAKAKNEDGKNEVKNDYYDEAVDISGTESVESEKEEPQPAVKKDPHAPPNPLAQAKVQQLGTDAQMVQKVIAPIGYNPSDYANLNVSAEITELFQYITRFKPQPIELETKLKPFIPEYIPAVGEVDAFLKIPRPDGVTESLGLNLLDEPTLNPSDPSVLEIQYTQWHKKKSSAPTSVRSIENAEKNPKEIQQWVSNINELHKSSPPQSVQYTKQMPDIEMLMQEWPADMESILEKVPFPGQELKINLEEYVRIICMMLDIPVHKLANNKSLIEALHVAFTLYLEFKQNPHFQKGGKQEQEKQAKPNEQVDYLKIG